MRILKSSQDMEWQEQCDACGCTFAYNPRDIRQETQRSYKNAEQGRVTLTVTCPECEKRVTVPFDIRRRQPVTDGWMN